MWGSEERDGEQEFGVVKGERDNSAWKDAEREFETVENVLGVGCLWVLHEAGKKHLAEGRGEGCARGVACRTREDLFGLCRGQPKRREQLSPQRVGEAQDFGQWIVG